MPSRLALVPFCGQAMGKGQLVLLLGDHGQCFKRGFSPFDLLALLRVHPPPGSMSSLFLFASKMPPVSRSVPYPYSYTTMGLQAKIDPFFALFNKSSEQRQHTALVRTVCSSTGQHSVKRGWRDAVHPQFRTWGALPVFFQSTAFLLSDR